MPAVVKNINVSLLNNYKSKFKKNIYIKSKAIFPYAGSLEAETINPR
jgi:hypothetical protein